ncbi:MAG: 16S rRNA (guanine(527)-N(7))-methyltransferase RsmG [Bacteroidales bacterium]|nr:16S rRNA (guanine(527)-N(7))-methyltransferase RsmG [Bacteroidales bacterium]
MEQILEYFPGLTSLQKERFAALQELYADWNSKINVISRKDMESFYEHHVLHSLAIAAAYDSALAAKSQSILDVGTGGGFPGIPLAIFYPENKFTLCDSIGKKIKVASAVAQALHLDNVTCINARAEALPERYDWIVSRAVTSMDKFLPWVRGKYGKGIICLKGGDVESELQVCFSRRLLNPKKVSVSDISLFFKEDWFETKKVVFISQ